MERFRQYSIARGQKDLSAEDIGAVVLRALMVRRPRVRYAVVRQRFANWTWPNLLSKRRLD